MTEVEVKKKFRYNGEELESGRTGELPESMARDVIERGYGEEASKQKEAEISEFGTLEAEPKDIEVPSQEHDAYIITARGRLMRGATEDWLDENGIDYTELYLYDGPSHIFDELSKGAINDTQSVFRASVIKRLGLDVFVEDRACVRKRLEKTCPNCRIISPKKFEKAGCESRGEALVNLSFRPVLKASVYRRNKGVFQLNYLMKKTTISLNARHYTWMSRNPEFCLAAFVRKKLDNEIEREGHLVKEYTISKWLANERNIPQVLEGVELRVREKAIRIAPMDGSLGETMWLPKSQIENKEPTGLYEEEVCYPG